MRNFQGKKGLNYFLQSKPVLFLLAFVLIVFAWNIFGLIGKWEDTEKNKKNEQAKITDLKTRKEKLISDIEKLNTDAGKEEVIRDNFGMAREGEGVVVIVDDKKISEKEEDTNTGGFFDFFRNLFK